MYRVKVLSIAMGTLALASQARGVFFTSDGHLALLQTSVAKSEARVTDPPAETNARSRMHSHKGGAVDSPATANARTRMHQHQDGGATESPTTANITTALADALSDPEPDADALSASDPDEQATEPPIAKSANMTIPYRAADALSIKTQANSNLCLDASLGLLEDAQIYMHPCNGEDQEQFYFEGMKLKNKHYTELCLDESRFKLRADNDKTGYMNGCNSRVNQKWIYQDGTLKTMWKYSSADLCLTYHSSNHLVDMEECVPDDVNQQFYFE